MKKENQTYLGKIKHIRLALVVEILLTIALMSVVYLIGLYTMTKQAMQYASDVKTNYESTINGYITTFNTMTLQLKEKIASNISYEEMNHWLQSMDAVYRQAIGPDVYDGISMTYRGGYARSWSYGDYTDYDPGTRPWYQEAQAANGDVTVVPPYVTYLDPSYLADDEYILLTIAQKYNDEISFDYDLKILGLEKLLMDRKPIYNGTRMLLLNPDGYVLSSNKVSEFAHNVNVPDDIISPSMSAAITKMMTDTEKLDLTMIDGVPFFTYSSASANGNVFCNMYPFVSVVAQDFLVICLVVLFLLAFELWMYRNNKRSLMEFKSRDDRLNAISHAAFQHRMYVDLETMIFYDNENAKTLCPSGKYEDLYEKMLDWVTGEDELETCGEFLSPQALRESTLEPYKLVSKRIAMKWPDENRRMKPRIIEISRLDSIIEGRRVTGILSRDVTEDATILKDALKQAESASQAKGDFMSRMSHEIRTPLNAVIGYLDIAKDEKEDTEKVAHCLEQSSIAAKHLLNIINDVLDISSIESGRMKIADEDFDLTQLIHSLTTIFYAQAKKKGVKFDVNVDDLSEEWVCGDSLRVNQILMNLLSNAIKFTPENGEVRLLIRQVGLHDEKVHLQFKISDTGIGMSREYSERMFTPFEQESATTAKNYGGTGLGLSISNSLVKMMGGTIEVETEQGKGTTFTVMLAFGMSNGKASAHLTTESFSKLRALVVDDEENACEYIGKLLGRCGVKCDTVTSGKKAVRRVKNRLASEYPYDFCIVDWNMEEMDGLETARQIREICGKDIPIIIATSYDYSSIIDEARQAGVDKIVSKPLFQSTLFDLLVNTYGKYEPTVSKKEKRKVDFHGKRVVIAEDNAMNMEIAVDILSKAGLEVIPVVNGKEAVDVFAASAPNTIDAILMDVQMPVMDGYEATRAIRKLNHPQAKTIPIIAMTANAFTSDVNAALASGMNDHIAKPISYERLFDTLSRLTGEGRPVNE